MQYKDDHGNGTEEDDEWEYVEDGPAEIIWEGNEITVKKKMVKVPKKAKENQPIQQVQLLWRINSSLFFPLALTSKKI